MNALEQYAALLRKHFGDDVPAFDTNSNLRNNVTGALNHTQFSDFQKTYDERLARLAARYPIGNPNRGHVLEMLKRITGKTNWIGAYGEFVALDFLNSDEDYLSQPISLSRTVSAAKTLGQYLGKVDTNYDGFYDDFGVYFDVKAMTRKARMILDGIIAEAIKTLGLTGVTITPEYREDSDFSVYEENRAALLSELRNALDGKKPNRVESGVLPHLCYRILRGAGTVAAVSEYSPYEDAKNNHTLLFTHAAKFSISAPSVIVFVWFPWFSGLSHPFGFNRIYYRSFCRRFFCQYMRDERAARDVMEDFNGDITMQEVASSLSGVLFIEDNTSIKPEEKREVFAYLNPNAKHKVSGHFRDHLTSLRFHVDDFEDDNY